MGSPKPNQSIISYHDLATFSIIGAKLVSIIGATIGIIGATLSPVLKIRFGPPTADFWSVWSSQKARKFQQIQPMTY